jgi:hypothetical protein
VNDHPGLHHKMGEWTRCTGRALASSGGRTQHTGRQVHDSDRITFEVMTFTFDFYLFFVVSVSVFWPLVCPLTFEF